MLTGSLSGVMRDYSLVETWLEEESLELLYKYAGNRVFPNLRSLSWPIG